MGGVAQKTTQKVRGGGVTQCFLFCSSLPYMPSLLKRECSLVCFHISMVVEHKCIFPLMKNQSRDGIIERYIKKKSFYHMPHSHSYVVCHQTFSCLYFECANSPIAVQVWKENAFLVFWNVLYLWIFQFIRRWLQYVLLLIVKHSGACRSNTTMLADMFLLRSALTGSVTGS